VTAQQLGLSVNTKMPLLVYDLMDLYPQGGKNRPSVLFVPVKPGAAERATPADSSSPAPTP